MSYILDALNKAERERGVKQEPGLPAVQESGRGRRPLRAFMVAGILVGLAVVVVLLLPVLKNILVQTPRSPAGAGQIAAGGPELESSVKSTAPAAGQTLQSAPPVPPEPGASQDLRAASSGSRRESAADSAMSRKSSEDAQPPGGAIQNPASNPSGGAAPVSLPAAGKEQAASANTAVPAQKEPVRTPEAPQAAPLPLKEAIAKMALNILVYHDDEAQRMAYINGKKYVRGDLIDGLYLIDSISPEGVWLRYGGQRLLLR